MISLLVVIGLGVFVMVASLRPRRRLADGLLVAMVAALQPVIWWVFRAEWQTRLQVYEQLLALGMTSIAALVARRYTPWLSAMIRAPDSPPARTSQPRTPAAAATGTREPIHRSHKSSSGSQAARSPAVVRPVFLSYRRDDSPDVVGRVYDRLVQRFGEGQVFKDVDSIRLGVDFRQHIRDAVSECAALLVVIGPGWIGATDPTGRRRLDGERDYVRLEIETALQRSIPVIPVLVRGATVPSEEQLPASIGAIAYRNGIDVRPDPDFHRDMDRLIASLEGPMGHASQPV